MHKRHEIEPTLTGSLFNRAAECGVIQSAILGNDLREIFTRLEPGHFSHAPAERAFRLLRKLYHQGKLKAIDDSLQAELVANEDIGACFAEGGGIADVQRVIELAQRRRIVEAAQGAIDAASDIAKPLAEVQETVPTICQRAIDPSAGDGPDCLSAKDAGREAMEYVQAARNGDIAFVPWGLTEKLDRAKLRPGTLTLLGARPGIGKTAFMISAGIEQAKAGHGVGWFCIEMQRQQLVIRAWANLSGIDYNTIENGLKNITSDDRTAFQYAADTFQGLPIHIAAGQPMMLAQIEARASYLVQEQGVKVLYLDYAQKIADAVRGREMRERNIQVAYSMKGLAQKLNVPIVLLAQLGRQAVDTYPIVSHLKESGAYEEEADAVILLDRPEYDAVQVDGTSSSDNGRGGKVRSYPGMPADMRGWAVARLGKTRNADGGIVPLAFEGPTMRFRKPEPGELAQHREF